MDLSVFEQDETCDVIIVDPTTGENTDVVVTVFSVDSKQYRKTAALIAKGDVKVEDGVYMLASLTKSWKNVEFKDKELKLTVDNAMKLYTSCPFIYVQLEKVIFDRVKFMKALPKAQQLMLKMSFGCQDMTKAQKQAGAPY